MSDSEKIATLEKTVFKQDELLQSLSEKSHEFDIELTKVMGVLKGVTSSYHRLDVQLTRYMDEGREATQKIYKRFDSFDNELKASFKERDKEIVDLKIDSAKVNTKQLIYASIMFTIITLGVKYLL